MLLKRFAFPALYISFLVPVLLGSPLLFKSIVIVVTVALSFYLNRPLALRMALLLVLALGTLIPLLALVQGAACWIPLNPFGALFRCVADSSRAVVLNAAVLGVAAMLLVTNEWRGSMLDTRLRWLAWSCR